MKTKAICLLALALLAGFTLADGQQAATYDSLNVRNIFRWGGSGASLSRMALESDSTIWSCYTGDTLVEIIATDPDNIDTNFYSVDSTINSALGIVDDSILIVSGYQEDAWLRSINIRATPPVIVANYQANEVWDSYLWRRAVIFDSMLVTHDADTPLTQLVFLNLSNPTDIDTFITGFGGWEDYGFRAPAEFAKKDSMLYGTWLGCLGGAPCNWTLYISVINISDYSNPVLDTVVPFSRTYGAYSASGNDAPCIVVDSFLIVAINNNECSHHCEVFDISNPMEPIYCDSFGGNHGTGDVDYQEPYLYAGDYIYDLSGYPESDSLIAYYVGSSTPHILIPNGKYYYTKNGLGFEIFEFLAWDSLQGISTEPANRDTYEEMFLLPNPANRFANIRIPEPLAGEIEIYNILAQRIAGREVVSSKTDYSFDLSNYSPGLYLVTVRSGELRISKKLIVLE